jgi:tetratricopeptide (TPR) repeat protein
MQSGHFAEVRQIEKRLLAVGVRTGRLANLTIQAERGSKPEIVLAQAGGLTDFEYGLDGRPLPIKGLPLPDEKLAAAWEEALKEYPDDPWLLLNYGHYLLKQNRLADAEGLFRRAPAWEEVAAPAHLGLGLAAFEGEHFEQALVEFQAARRCDPKSWLAAMNCAICLERLDRKQQAIDAWSEAIPLAPSPDLAKQVQAHLQELRK